MNRTDRSKAFPPSVEAASLVDAAATLADDRLLTWPSDVPQHRLDYVFVRDLVPVRATVLDVRASDHRPVLVELAWA